MIGHKPPVIKAIVFSAFITLFLCLISFPKKNLSALCVQKKSNPRVVITKVKVLGQYHQIRTDADIREVFEYPEEVKVPWKDNFLRIEFEMKESSEPEKNEYAYKIIGENEDWIHIGNKNFVILENLEAGKYQLAVKGANSESVWDEEGTVLTLYLVPAWWRTPLVKIILIMAGLSVLLVLYRLWRKFSRSWLQGEIDINRIASEFLLTKRETEILELLLKGKRIKEISKERYISESTVQKHIYSVYKKLKIRSRIQLISFSQRYRLK